MHDGIYRFNLYLSVTTTKQQSCNGSGCLSANMQTRLCLNFVYCLGHVIFFYLSFKIKPPDGNKSAQTNLDYQTHFGVFFSLESWIRTGLNNIYIYIYLIIIIIKKTLPCLHFSFFIWKWKAFICKRGHLPHIAKNGGKTWNMKNYFSNLSKSWRRFFLPLMERSAKDTHLSLNPLNCLHNCS